MDAIDSKIIDELVDIIYKRIEERFDKKINNINVEFSAMGIVRTVETVDNIVTKADVELSFSTLADLPNKTGETLQTGDKVKIFYDKTNMSNAYIGVLLEKIT